MTQITANLMGEKIATNCSRATALALDGLTKKYFGYYALLKIFPSDHQEESLKIKQKALVLLLIKRFGHPVYKFEITKKNTLETKGSRCPSTEL